MKEFRPFHKISTTGNNATLIKAERGEINTIVISNVNAAMRYLKLYDLKRTPVPSSDTPVFTIPIPGNTAGAGGAISFPEGLTFYTGIGIAIVSGIADNDNGSVTANDISVSLAYN